MSKQRLGYIDIAKGVLILFLLMGHALLFIKNEGINDSFINDFQRIRGYLWSPYYMPAFFVITGFCSNFSKPFPTFLWQNFKTLKIPAIIFGTLIAVVAMTSHHTLSATAILKHLALCWVNSGLWFLDALFISKLLYWCINRCCRGEVMAFIACVIFFIAGFIYYRYITSKDFGCLAHALLMTIFLFVGRWLKKRQDAILRLRPTLMFLAVYITVAVIVNLCGINIPYITHKIQMSWISLVPFICLSISGSVVIIYLCQLIGRCRWLQWIGENSLVFYMFNMLALNVSIKLLAKYMTSHIACIALYVAVMLMTCMILVIITRIINTKYLKFTLGKF